MTQYSVRLLSVLEEVAQHPGTITEIAQRIDVHKSTALRLLRQLEERKFVRRDENGVFHGGSQLISLGQSVLETYDIRTAAHEELENLSRITRQTVHLAVLEGSRVIYIAKHEPDTPIRMYSQIGGSAPLHCTGVGKAVLAWSNQSTVEQLRDTIEFTVHTAQTLTNWQDLIADLAVARRRGYAIDDREHEDFIHCISSPIRSATGETIGSASVTAVTITPIEELKSFAPELLQATQTISHSLGWQP